MDALQLESLPLSFFDDALLAGLRPDVDPLDGDATSTPAAPAADVTDAPAAAGALKGDLAAQVRVAMAHLGQAASPPPPVDYFFAPAPVAAKAEPHQGWAAVPSLTQSIKTYGAPPPPPLAVPTVPPGGICAWHVAPPATHLWAGATTTSLMGISPASPISVMPPPAVSPTAGRAAAPLPPPMAGSLGGGGAYSFTSTVTAAGAASPTTPDGRLPTGGYKTATPPTVAATETATETAGEPSTSLAPKRYPCHLCGRTFTENSNRQKHVQTVHLNLRGHACTTCGASFSARCNLAKHVSVVHERARPYACPLCPSAFGERNKRDKHLRTVHGGEKPHACGRCGRPFGQRSDLVRHVRVVHEQVRPHGCGVCGKGFGRRGSLVHHMKQAHPRE
ncbi:hypothetical protein BU14_1432s0002 [Porphyra umbilicalis]|uniref:C2H2-type domain-containing protein n=1 Tax=Porphyra umbilicalis TaxID=2786 RepID=A0A1X6NLS8_PORUM|nr:hypothetical protein BU14_1432s0002 [Porphyra umbilicalis]|eukprot:OSX69522.1 hypothetical protein BU14_1432s0002 [Porphyra umbilicalis]